MASSDINEKIEEALRRFREGMAPRRIPADPCDADLVLADCQAEIARLRTLMQGQGVDIERGDRDCEAVVKERDAARVRCRQLEAENNAMAFNVQSFFRVWLEYCEKKDEVHTLDAEVARLREDVTALAKQLASDGDAFKRMIEVLTGKPPASPYASDRAKEALVAVGIAHLNLSQLDGLRRQRNAAQEQAAAHKRSLDVLRIECAAARVAIHAIYDLIEASHGVTGLHRNGDVVPWSELQAGGRFESWLAALQSASDAAVATDAAGAMVLEVRRG